jgi:type IV secretory pathway VirB2 component (pilin)
MTRIRIIIPAATIERTKLYLVRGAALLLCVLIFPLAAHASPFDSGISSIQTLFTGTIAKAANLIATVIGGYTFAQGEPGAKKTLAGVAAGTGVAIMATNILTWLGVPSPVAAIVSQAIPFHLQRRSTSRGLCQTLLRSATSESSRVCISPSLYGHRTHAVFHDRGVCRGHVQPLQFDHRCRCLFIGGCIFGHWVTNSNPAFLKILGRSEKFKLRYDAAKQAVPNVEVR